MPVTRYVEYAVAHLVSVPPYNPDLQLPMGSLEFLIDCDPAVTQPLTEMNAGGISLEVKAAGA